MKSQLALVGIFNEFCFNYLMIFLATKLYSHSHAGGDIVQTVFRIILIHVDIFLRIFCSYENCD